MQHNTKTKATTMQSAHEKWLGLVFGDKDEIKQALINLGREPKDYKE